VRRDCRFGRLLLAIVVLASCGHQPTGPSPNAGSLPLVEETATMRYYREADDTIEVPRQEAFNAWALDRLGIVSAEKVEYRKYRSREAMGRYTGVANTNGFAEPSLRRIHTIWPYDNHEVVHVLTATFGRPSDFFNEGIAVSFQTDPSQGHFTAEFNGQPVHEACRAALQSGTLPLPLSRYVTTEGFRGLANFELSYRMAGSFMLYLSERFGLAVVLRFFQGGTPTESLNTITARLQSVFGVSLENLESGWLTMLRM
jgi:hypothetical protein